MVDSVFSPALELSVQSINSARNFKLISKATMTKSGDENGRNFSGTVIKALDVLDCLADHAQPMTTQKIADACGLSRPTTYRLLTTLMSRGFVRDEGGFRYALGLRLLSLSRRVLDDLNLVELARPYLYELCTLSGETANLGIADGMELLYIGKEESPNRTELPQLLQLRSSVGARLSLHATAMGKVLLAMMPAPQREALLGSFPPLKAYTVNTITDIEALQRELESIRAQGYAIDDGEVDDGTRCVAAPVFDSTGRVVAAMSIAGPAYRLTRDRVQSFSNEVKRGAWKLSAQLGYLASPLG